MEINLSQKIPQYYCETCNYYTSYSKDYKKHILTKKHIMVSVEINGNNEEIKKSYICQNCNKEFKTNAGLWKHNKKCNKHQKHDTEEPTQNASVLGDKELIMMLINQNK